MDKKEFRAVIKHYFLKGKTTTQIQAELQMAHVHSPDLAPCDFFLVPNLKIWLGGKKFASNEEVISAPNVYFVVFQPSYFLDDLNKLEHRWTNNKCIELKGDCIEK
ncbi:hypothetical protein ALC62_05286 [Cyphomyrmex costatus]|uniref:Mos1 transposase HTH domain-containing protein n=1 Tax=Cyphomyrmex costatus TaxID=456900 RepID=A0A151IJM7_9HYME|nr:hypothetical protein ALC62_05286 [Cyphomyrmex costatus]